MHQFIVCSVLALNDVKLFVPPSWQQQQQIGNSLGRRKQQESAVEEYEA